MELAPDAGALRSPVALPRSRAALGTLTNSPRLLGSPAMRSPKRSPNRRPRLMSTPLSSLRPAFPYLRARSGSFAEDAAAANATGGSKATPTRLELGSLLATLRVDEPEVGVKKLKAKVQQKQPTWKVGCKQIRVGLQSTPVRTALASAVTVPAVEDDDAPDEDSMLHASLRTISLDVSGCDPDDIALAETSITSPPTDLRRRPRSESLVDLMRAVEDSVKASPAPSPVPLVERMKAAAASQAAASEPAVPSEMLPPPPPLPRRAAKVPPPLPPRDHVIAAASALTLGLRWKRRATLAAQERNAEAEVEALLDEIVTGAGAIGRADSTPTEEVPHEGEELDENACLRRRAFLESTTSNLVLPPPVMRSDSSTSSLPDESDKESDFTADILASPTVEARSRRSAFLRQELTAGSTNSLLLSAEKFIAARTLSRLEEMQMSPLRTLSWNHADPADWLSDETEGDPTAQSTDSSSSESGEMTYEELQTKLLSAAEVAPSSESRSYLTQLYKMMIGITEQRDQQAGQLKAAQAQAANAEARVAELQDKVQALKEAAATPIVEEDLPTPAPHVAAIAAAQLTQNPRRESQPKKQKQNKRVHGGADCGCGSRPTAAAVDRKQQFRQWQQRQESLSAAPGQEWTAAIFEKYAEDPTSSQRILLVSGETASEPRLASAALADLVEIVYLPRLEKLTMGPVAHATTALLSLLPTSNWAETGSQWTAMSNKFGLAHGFATGFTREQFTAWDASVARECSMCVSTPRAPKSRWLGKRRTAAPTAEFLVEYGIEHYSALEDGWKNEERTPTPTPSGEGGGGSGASLSTPVSVVSI